MSSSFSTDRHPDVGDLADEIAGVASPAVAEHLLGCHDCSTRLAALTTASTSVTSDLRADPEPELPAAVAARFAQAIAAESAARRPTSAPAVPGPNRPPVRSGRGRDGWWARHTRLGGVLVTAAALVVVGGGGPVVANWMRGGNPSNQAASTGTAQEDAAAPGSSDLRAPATPLGAVAGTVALHRTAFPAEVGDLVSGGTRALRALTSAQATCATGTLAHGDLAGAPLTALSGAYTLDGTRVLVVVARHDGTRTAVAISGCSSGHPIVAVRGDLP